MRRLPWRCLLAGFLAMGTAGLPVAVPTAQASPTPSVPAESVGVAHRLLDGTLVLRLRAPLQGGAGVGEAEFRYAPGTRDYAEVMAYLDGLEPGQSKPVPPWPDTPSSPLP